MSDRFFVDEPLGPGPVTVRGPEARHMAIVCRLRPDHPVCLFNGDGRQYPAVIRALSKKEVELEVVGVESPARELGFLLEVAAPLPRGDRGHFLVEKLTELGVTRYVAIRTQHSVFTTTEARVEKLRTYVVEASKQCGRNVLMEVAEPQSWAEYVAGSGCAGLRLVLDPGAAGGLPAAFTAGLRVAVGPEGGFTEAEIGEAVARGWTRASLGPRVLRVETAALAVAAWAATRREEL